jgi:RNA polymerase sigma-70 factor (ECF subfamily)
MAERLLTGSDCIGASGPGTEMIVSDADDWFMREVLPLEATLMLYLRQNWRQKADIADLRQEVYMRVYEAAQKEIPEQAKAFVLTTARNMLIDRVRAERVIPIDVVNDLEALGVASDLPGPDHAILARDALRRLQAALDHLPTREREAIVYRKLDGLSRRDIATRMGVSEFTVKTHITRGMRALADALFSERLDLRKK